MHLVPWKNEWSPGVLPTNEPYLHSDIIFYFLGSSTTWVGAGKPYVPTTTSVPTFQPIVSKFFNCPILINESWSAEVNRFKYLKNIVEIFGLVGDVPFV